MLGTTFRLVGVAAALSVTWSSSNAAVVVDTMSFSTSGQSMWSEGAEAVFDREVFLGTRWGTYDGGAAERVELGGIIGEANYQVPGTGGTIPNPGRIAWDAAMATCELLSSRSTCINGTSAVRACAPSYLGGGCVTIVPAIPGLGNAPAATIANPIPGQFIDTRTGAKGGIDASGEAGFIPWVRAEGGGIDVLLPVTATVTMSDNIVAGGKFTINTSYAVDGGATITANAPSFAAGVDGIFNSENRLFGEACVLLAGCTSGSTNVNVMPGRFGIVSVDLAEDNFLRIGGDDRGAGSIGVPGIAFNEQYNFHAPSPSNPDGVDDDTTPQTVPTPRLGDFMVSNLSDLSGGTTTGNKVAFVTDQRLLSLNASVTGIGELALGSPGVLSNSVDVGPFELSYTLLDVGVGPRLGMRQEFEIDPNAMVRLEFDRPVVRVVPDSYRYVERIEFVRTCIAQFFGTCFAYADLPRTVREAVLVPGGLEFVGNVIDVALGDSVELQFAGEVGNLISRTYFLKDPDFSNRTAATIDPGIKIEMGCIGIAISLLSADDCAFQEDYATTALVDLEVYRNSWALGGFGEFKFTSSFGPGTPGGGGSVPEPSPLLLVGLGLLMLSLRRRGT